MYYRKDFRYKNADFNGNFSEKLTKARDWLADWQNKTNNLFVCGSTGCGKTYLAMAFMNELSKTAQYFPATKTFAEWWNIDDVFYVVTKELFDTIRTRFSSNSAVSMEAKQAVSEWTKCKLLIIDEFGLGYGTDSELIELTELLDYRWKKGLPTVFLSNLGMKALMEYLKDRAAQRAFDDANYVEIKESSMRKKPKEL